MKTAFFASNVFSVGFGGAPCVGSGPRRRRRKSGVRSRSGDALRRRTLPNLAGDESADGLERAEQTPENVRKLLVETKLDWAIVAGDIARLDATAFDGGFAEV